MSKTTRNVNSLFMDILPDNRPVTSIQIVEDFVKCPKNFTAVHRTHDQDADADLWRESIVLFGKGTRRYLCLSKSEGLPEYIVETLKVIAEREIPPEGFSLLSRTADSEQKAWRKRQIAYKLSKRGSVSQAVTDIILCSKMKMAPTGFQLAGEINGVVICFKVGPVTHRPPPTVPPSSNKNNLISDLENSLHYINISSKPLYPLPNRRHSQNLSPKDTAAHHDYEEIQSSYKLSSSLQNGIPAPVRAAPHPPNVIQHHTLSDTHSDIEGVPFMMNPHIIMSNNHLDVSSSMNLFNSVSANMAYDFQLERQVLCTTKTASTAATNSKNPFFQ